MAKRSGERCALSVSDPTGIAAPTFGNAVPARFPEIRLRRRTTLLATSLLAAGHAETETSGPQRLETDLTVPASSSSGARTASVVSGSLPRPCASSARIDPSTKECP